jgi:hypothetical protein
VRGLSGLPAFWASSLQEGPTGENAPDVARNNLPDERRLPVILMDFAIPAGQMTLAARTIAHAAVDALGPNDLAAVVRSNPIAAVDLSRRRHLPNLVPLATAGPYGRTFRTSRISDPVNLVDGPEALKPQRLEGLPSSLLAFWAAGPREPRGPRGPRGPRNMSP